MIERALAAADAAEIEAQHGKTAMGECVVALVDDLMIHRAVKLRVRMQDHRDRRVLLLGGMITAFEAARGTGENDFRHRGSLAKSTDVLLARSGGFADKTLRNEGADQTPLVVARTANGELEAAF